MVNTIDNHRLSPRIRELANDDISLTNRAWKKWSDEYTESTDVLGGADYIITGVESAVYALLSGRSKAEILRFLTVAKEGGVSHFMLATLPPGRKVALEIDNHAITALSKPTKAYMDIEFWLKVFHLTLMLRDRDSMHLLLALDESVFDNADVESDAFDRALFHLIRSIFIKGEDVHARMQGLVDASEPQNFTDRRRPWAYALYLPLLPLIESILCKNREAEYQADLLKACHMHIKHWKKYDKYNNRGGLSLPLTAFAALAHDVAGYKTNIDSTYIPDWLVRGDFTD